MKAFVSLLFLIYLFSACNSDKGTDVCVPTSLRAYNDSIIYQYNDKHELTALLYFGGKVTMTSRTDLAYNNGKIVTVDHTSVSPGSNPSVFLSCALEYGSDGMPSKLTEFHPATPHFKDITEFTHDSNKRLIKAITTITLPGSTQKTHIGGYIYEYNDAGNVTTVKYILRNDNGPGTKEVLARENLTFDDRPKFYLGSKHLTTLNVYVYKHIPNATNNLTARVHYYSYNSYPLTPVNLTFTISYDQNGRIVSNSNVDIFSIPAWGDLLFTKAKYECF